MATRTFSGTLDTFEKDSAASELTYLGPTSTSNGGEAVRAFRINPAGTGNHIVNIDRSNSVLSVEIFQEDSYTGTNAPAGYKKFCNIAEAGKGKGAVAVNVTNAAKNYVVMLKLDGYSEVSYGGNVVVP
tara:strand:+ start:5574 stop:5960 length:387 start_codon:yes stop_codon:yes gene_type:complete